MKLDIDKSGVEKKFYELALKLASENALELYDLEYIPSKGLLRIFIMNPETKTALIEDCAKIDHAFDPYLEESWVPDFTLEVSSPGMFRSLKTKRHFEISIGEYVKLTLAQAVEGEMKLRAKLEDIKEDKLTINYKNKSLDVSFEQIKKAQLDPSI
jgi:ribosome maturation factor RimP